MKVCRSKNLAQGEEAHWAVRGLFDGEGVQGGYVVDKDVVQDSVWDIRGFFGALLVDDPFMSFGDVSGELREASEEVDEALSIEEAAARGACLALP